MEVAFTLIDSNNTVLKGRFSKRFQCYAKEIKKIDENNHYLFEKVVDDLAALNMTTLVERNLQELSETAKEKRLKKANFTKSINRPAGVVVVNGLSVSKCFENGAENSCHYSFDIHVKSAQTCSE